MKINGCPIELVEPEILRMKVRSTGAESVSWRDCCAPYTCISRGEDTSQRVREQ